MRQRILSARGYQTGPFAALCTFHFLNIFHIFHIHTGEANSYYPRGPIWRKGTFCQLQNWMRQWVLSAWGINPGPFWASWAKILPKIFGPLYHYTGGSLFLLPQKTEKGRRRWKSQKVSHPSTNRAQQCLTSAIGRALVYSMWYGRCREKRVKRGKVHRQDGVRLGFVNSGVGWCREV